MVSTQFSSFNDNVQFLFPKHIFIEMTWMIKKSNLIFKKCFNTFCLWCVSPGLRVLVTTWCKMQQHIYVFRKKKVNILIESCRRNFQITSPQRDKHMKLWSDDFFIARRLWLRESMAQCQMSQKHAYGNECTVYFWLLYILALYTKIYIWNNFDLSWLNKKHTYCIQILITDWAVE